MNLDDDLLAEVISALPDPVFVLTESGRYAALVGGTDRRYYHDGARLVGQSLYDVLPLDKADWFVAQISKTLDEGGMRVVEYTLGGVDVAAPQFYGGPDGVVHFEGRVQPLRSPVDGERAVVWVAHNVTERVAFEHRLRLMSETDDLTGVANRRKMLQVLADSFQSFVREGYPSAFMMLDVDHFKQVNDRLGHPAGDGVLRQVAALCQRELRRGDLLARVGGEEFGALLPNCGVVEARMLAERLRLAIAGSRSGVTISVGVTAFDGADSSIEGVLRRADDALYEAKRGGRNRVA